MYLQFLFGLLLQTAAYAKLSITCLSAFRERFVHCAEAINFYTNSDIPITQIHLSKVITGTSRSAGTLYCVVRHLQNRPSQFKGLLMIGHF